MMTQDKTKKLALLGLLTLSATLGTASATPNNNSLNIGAAQEPPQILDPWNTNNLTIITELDNFMKANLTYRDNSGKLIADIATQVPTAANGLYKETKDKSGKVTSNSLTYTIRPDAKWSDGAAITTADFEFWLKVQQDKRVPISNRYPFEDAKITRKDDKTFTITFNPPYLFAQLVGAPGLAPLHTMKTAWDAFDARTKGKPAGADLTEEWAKFISGFTTSTHLPPVVAGPFKPTAWRAGNSLTLTRNPNYWRKPEGGADKYIQTVNYRFIPNTNTLKLNILSGQLDAVSVTGLTFDQGLDMQKRQSNKYTTFFVPGSVWEHIDVNTQGQHSKDVGLSDERVRQALLYAIDREGTNKALFQGKQPVANSWVNPAAPVYSGQISTYPYNPAKAKALLAAAGWKPGPDGILVKNGKKMVLSFATTAGNVTRERVQQIFQAQWKAVGIQVNIQNYPASVLFSTEYMNHGEDGKWDLLMYSFTSDPATENGSGFLTSHIPNKASGYQGGNATGWGDPEYDRLQAASEINFDAASRKAQFAKMQAIWTKELPALPLYFRASVYTRTNGLVNFDFSSVTRYPTWDAYRIGWASKGAAEAHKQN